ncbi:MAG: hypothetical protein O8C61_08985 [Candidatus Methanoperedens sp.]|nr:hypothetical protein [Candidatus Methanoperedens sp.]
MKILRIFLSIFLIFALTDVAASQTQWINNITITEYNITWSYTEGFSGFDSIGYRISIDSGLGNNDSFVNAWELLKADKEVRKMLKSSIENEFDIRINNETSGIELNNIDSTLSQVTLGKIINTDTIINRFNITYRLKDSIFNDSSIWFLGEPNSPVTIVLPAGINVKEVTGMNNTSINTVSNTEITGFFKEMSSGRGEITLFLKKNASFVAEKPGIMANETSIGKDENISKPIPGVSSKIREWSIIGIGIIVIILIYFFKVKKK